MALIQPHDRKAWALPKGLIEKGEAPEVAAQREALEETGLSGPIVVKIDTITIFLYREMGASSDACLQNRHVLLAGIHGGRSFASRSRGGSRGMVSDRQGNCVRQLSAGKDDHPKSERACFSTIGRAHEDADRSLVCAYLSLSFSSLAPAQPIYAENQIPSRGVDISYTVTIKNPTSHLYESRCRSRAFGKPASLFRYRPGLPACIASRTTPAIFRISAPRMRAIKG